MNAIDLNALFGKADHLWRCFARCFPSSVSEHELDELYDEWLIHCTLPFTPLTSVGGVLTNDDRAWIYQDRRAEREREREERRAKAAKEAAHKAVRIAVYEAAKEAAHKAALQAIGRDNLEGATDEQHLTYDDVYESEMTAREGSWLEFPYDGPSWIGRLSVQETNMSPESFAKLTLLKQIIGQMSLAEKMAFVAEVTSKLQPDMLRTSDGQHAYSEENILCVALLVLVGDDRAEFQHIGGFYGAGYRSQLRKGLYHGKGDILNKDWYREIQRLYQFIKAVSSELKLPQSGTILSEKQLAVVPG